MKKQVTLATAFLALFGLFFSCNTEVDLLADGDYVPVVYALLDSDADTNYVKITHTLGSGDAILNADNPELSNYPGKLDVRLTEFCNGDSIRQIILDTITIHNKENGLFYAPAQKLYYTTERLGKNQQGKHYSYRLTAVLPDRTLTAKTDMVGSNIFRITSSVIDFSGGDFKGAHDISIAPALNAEIYDVSVSFTFLERRTFTSDTIPRTMTWSLGTHYLFELTNSMHEGFLMVSYRPYDLYVELRDFLGDDTLVPGLRRYITDDPVQVTVVAGGQDLFNYVYSYELNSQNMTDDNLFTNINGGYGVFSSKMKTTKIMRLGGTTIPELMQTKWGFKYIGGLL